MTIKPGAVATAEIIGAAASLIGTLSRSIVTIAPDATRPPQSAHALAGDAEVYVHLAGVVDLAAERTRLLKEIDKAKKEIAFLEGKLAARRLRRAGAGRGRGA